jgi:hypothetical protein
MIENPHNVLDIDVNEVEEGGEQNTHVHHVLSVSDIDSKVERRILIDGNGFCLIEMIASIRANNAINEMA